VADVSVPGEEPHSVGDRRLACGGRGGRQLWPAWVLDRGFAGEEATVSIQDLTSPSDNYCAHYPSQRFSAKITDDEPEVVLSLA